MSPKMTISAQPFEMYFLGFFSMMTAPFYIPLVVWAVWPDGYIICSTFGYLKAWKFAQKQQCTKVGS